MKVTGPLRSALAELVRGRRGVFRRAEALQFGYTDYEIRVHLEAGRWAVLHDSVYVERAVLEQAEREPDRHNVLLAEALALAAEDAAISHGSAARWHGLDHLADVGDRPQATWPRVLHQTPWTDGKVNVRSAGLPRGHVLTVDGVSVTTVARTVADVARDFGFFGGVVVGDSALAKGLVTRAEIEDVILTMAGWPGVRQARQVAECLDARAQSPLESVCHAVWWRAGLPRPELQVWVFDEFGFAGILDGMWLDRFVGYEVDGAVKYQELGQPDTLLREKARQERIEVAGVPIGRFGWNGLWQNGNRCVQRMKTTFAHASLLPPPRVRLYIGDRDVPAPDPTRIAGLGLMDPTVLGLRLVYDGLRVRGTRAS